MDEKNELEMSKKILSDIRFMLIGAIFLFCLWITLRLYR